MGNNVEYFSLNGEDFLLREFFGGVESGFYVDINVHDGLAPSNSLLFEKAGWKGVCIEPGPEYFPRCSENRSAAHCLNRVCTGEDGHLADAVNENDASSGGNSSKSVRMITLNEVFQCHAGTATAACFVSIRLNAAGLDMLTGFEYNKWRVRVFVLSASSQDQAKLAYKLMTARGYILSRMLGLTGIYSGNAQDVDFLKYKRIVCSVPAGERPGGDAMGGAGLPARNIIEEATCRVAPNVLCQQQGQPLWSLLDYFPKTTDRERGAARIVHMVNPYPASANSASSRHQQLTYDSMCVARDFDGGNITLVSVQHVDDAELTPAGFDRGEPLTRDVTAFGDFRRPQPLPLLFDILESGAALAGPDDVLIYTNSDIILMPYFYSAIRELLGFGFDALNICRRTLGEHALYSDHVNLTRSEVGYSHPGSDCFVFTKTVYSQFIRNHACIGKQGVAKSLLLNMAAAAQQMLVLKHTSLTCHLGDDRSWQSDDVQDYAAFNKQELRRVHQELCRDPGKREILGVFMKNYWVENILG